MSGPGFLRKVLDRVPPERRAAGEFAQWEQWLEESQHAATAPLYDTDDDDWGWG